MTRIPRVLFCLLGLVVVVLPPFTVSAMMSTSKKNHPLFFRQATSTTAAAMSSSPIVTLAAGKTRSQHYHYYLQQPRTATTTTSLSLSLLHLRGGSDGSSHHPHQGTSSSTSLSLGNKKIPSLSLSSQESSLSTTEEAFQQGPSRMVGVVAPCLVAGILLLLLLLLLGGGFQKPPQVLVWNMGHWYHTQLYQFPVVTKSITSGFLFGLSDYIAQRLTLWKTKKASTTTTTSRIHYKQLVATFFLGLLVFGPAAHYWYAWIFGVVFPERTLLSNICKFVAGQVGFSPWFTCLFFGTYLWAHLHDDDDDNTAITTTTTTTTNEFWQSWKTKIQNDLWSTWLSGFRFWPFVDIVKYSMIPVPYIPLYINVCSLLWTIYLCLVTSSSSSDNNNKNNKVSQQEPPPPPPAESLP